MYNYIIIYNYNIIIYIIIIIHNTCSGQSWVITSFMRGSSMNRHDMWKNVYTVCVSYTSAAACWLNITADRHYKS